MLRRPHARGPVIERASADDLMQLAVDVGPVPEQVGAVVLLDAGEGFDPGRAAALVARRLGTVPRLRQVLRPVPFGCGRPIWVDDTGFDAQRHIAVVACRPPGDEPALLAEAVSLVTEPLRPGSPPWRVAVLTGLADGRVAIVVVFHHVLADGIGGLAVLERLVDTRPTDAPAEAAPTVDENFPRPAPSPRELAIDAWTSRLRACLRVPATARIVAHDVVAMTRLGLPRASASSLNRPTGWRRRAVVARADLTDVRAFARDNDATVNDVVLASVAGALRELVVRRGESVPLLVASVPVARRTSTTADEIGNQLSGTVVGLSTHADGTERLRETAAQTRLRKQTSSDLLLGSVFRVVAALGLTRRFVSNQRMVTTFVTDLRGPALPLTFLGRPVLEVIPIGHLTGNVTTTFAALSYAGTLVITVVADPEACPDLDDLAAFLQAELDAVPRLANVPTT